MPETSAFWTENALLSAPRLSALVCLNAWGPIRDIALAWWRQGNSLGERLLQPIDCGSATLYILVGQAPEEVLQSVRGRTAGTERDASRNPPFCKLEPVPDPATGTTQSVTTSDQSRKQRYTSVALGDAALVNICIHSVVPFCIAVLHAVQLTDTMPITSAGVFDGLMRWALRLRPISTGLHLNSLREKQQCVVTALDEATVSCLLRSLDRCRNYCITGKTSSRVNSAACITLLTVRTLCCLCIRIELQKVQSAGKYLSGAGK